MTIEALAQFSAEHRVLTDLANYNTLPVIASAQAKTGSRSYQLAAGVGPFGKALLASKTAVRVGYWLYLATGTIDPVALIYQAGDGLGFDSTTSLIAVDVDDATGLMRIRRNDATSGDAPEILASTTLPSVFSTTGSWFHVGITHKIHASTGFLSVYINKLLVLNYLGDTRPSFDGGASATYQTSVSRVLGPGAGDAAQGFADAYVDDFFVDAIEGESDGVVPARQFLCVLASGTGQDAAFTPDTGSNYQMVDENPNDSDVTTNRATTANLRDTFNFDNITLPGGYAITAAIPSVFGRSISPDVLGAISLHAWDGLTYGDSSDQQLTPTYNVPVFARMETQPDASDWNETDFNAMQWGYRSRSTV